MTKSAYFSGEADDLYFSYETCGNPDAYTNWSVSGGVNGTSLWAAVNVGADDGGPGHDDTMSFGIIIGSFLVLLSIVVATGRWYLQRHTRKNRPIGPDLEAEMTKFRHERHTAWGSRRGRRSRPDVYEVRMPSELPRTAITVLAELGRGAFGVVSKAMYTPSTMSSSGSVDQLRFGIPVAVKTLVDGANLAARQEFAREAVISAQFVHRNVVGLVGVVTESDPYMLVLQYCIHGALNKIVATTDQPAITLIGYCVDIAVGMTHLASFKFVHRDLACRNVLIDDENNAKVADFGLSREMPNQSYYASHNLDTKLPLRWCAPEVFEELKFGESSDVWSFGVTMIEVFTKAATPYYGKRIVRPTLLPPALHVSLQPTFLTVPVTVCPGGSRLDQRLRMRTRQDRVPPTTARCLRALDLRQRYCTVLQS